MRGLHGVAQPAHLGRGLHRVRQHEPVDALGPEPADDRARLSCSSASNRSPLMPGPTQQSQSRSTTALRTPWCSKTAAISVATLVFPDPSGPVTSTAAPPTSTSGVSGSTGLLSLLLAGPSAAGSTRRPRCRAPA